jgi:hypothetical protein
LQEVTAKRSGGQAEGRAGTDVLEAPLGDVHAEVCDHAKGGLQSTNLLHPIDKARFL